MEFISNVLMLAGTIGCGFYCFVLSQRLSKFKSMETGVGKAVADLSTRVTELNNSIASARAAALESQGSLVEVTERAEKATKHLELQMASLHDLPTTKEVKSVNIERDEGPVFSSRNTRVMR